MLQANRDFIAKAEEAAEASGHPFPTYAACEAALESGHPDPVTGYTMYGTSKLAVEGNNLFGMKQHSTPVYETLVLPTWEVVNGKKVPLPDAHWVKYPDWSSCFADRLATLQKMAPKYPHYAAALAAQDGETFVREVSKTWSTDPDRGQKVIDIKNKYLAQ